LDALLETIPPVAVGPSQISRPSRETRAKMPAPAEIRCTLGSSVSLERSGLPPWLLSQFKHLAGLHNPEFYKREKLRLSTHLIPRFIKCYQEDFSHIHLPRGVFDEVAAVCEEAGSRLVVTDNRPILKHIPFDFHGKLTPEQGQPTDAALSHELGVLVAPPGAGKTVMGCFVLAKRKLPTLILAHRKPILEQWRKQIVTLLDLPSAKIGQIGGGRDRQSGVVDLAMIQSLGRMEDLSDFFSHYGFIIVDECHHLPAATFEACLRNANVRYILGLTATPYRRDGLQDIIAMQCGPIRHRMQETGSDLRLTLNFRQTNFSTPPELELPIQETFRALVHDGERSDIIVQDALTALGRGRRCLVLSQWKEHCHLLAEKLKQQGKEPFILSGGMGKKERTAILKAIQEMPSNEELVVLATGQYLGEGFDCPQLDTLFLAFPVAFKGKLIQYVGRIMRSHPGKTTAEVFDYVDDHVPVLKRMASRRQKIYRTIGFDT
jgi:superfamily II DNA or RNA helicase